MTVSIRDAAIRVRDFARNTKNRLRLNTSFLAAKRRGDILKRIQGFDRLFQYANGSTVLDLGCYDGLVAYEFFRSGATLIHGLDNDARHLDTANRIFSQVNIPTRFAHADLRKADAIEVALGGSCLRTYDIVLFLGVFQHMYKPLSGEARQALVEQIVDRVGSILAVRIPAHTWNEFERCFDGTEFEKIDEIPQAGNVGELRVYRRRSK